MSYFSNCLFLLICLGFGGGIAFAQPIDTLKTCIEQNFDSSKNTGYSLIINDTIYEKQDNRQILVVEYEFPQKVYRNIYSKGHKDVYVQLCLNNQWITKLDPSVCGDLGRVKGRRGKLKIKFNRLTTGEPESAFLYGILIEEEKPPIKKWVSKSFLSPNWAHKQMKAFDKEMMNLPEVADTVLSKKKKRPAILISSLLVVGGLFKLTSVAHYQTAKRKYDNGYINQGRFFYKKANKQHKTALVFAGVALLVDLRNVISVFSKGNKKMKSYHENKPKGRKCTDW